MDYIKFNNRGNLTVLVSAGSLLPIKGGLRIDQLAPEGTQGVPSKEFVSYIQNKYELSISEYRNLVVKGRFDFGIESQDFNYLVLTSYKKDVYNLELLDDLVSDDSLLYFRLIRKSMDIMGLDALKAQIIEALVESNGYSDIKDLNNIINKRIGKALR